MAEIRLGRREANGELPAVCACCGTLCRHFEIRNMSWCPAWVQVLILFGVVPCFILALVLTRRATVQIPLCDKHMGHWSNRTLLSGGLFLLIGVLSIPLLINVPNEVMPFACVGCFILLVVWLVFVVILEYSAIRPKVITDYEIVLRNVSSAFVEAVHRADERRNRTSLEQARDGRLEDGEDDWDASPRKDSTASDAIEDQTRRAAPPDAIEE
jgi:hypothetical protein